MSVLASLSPGSYRPGVSVLHRLDPRLKGVLAPLLVAAVFAGHNTVQLGVMTLILSVAWWLGGEQLAALAGLPRTLRWLLLFTLLVHLLFAPGHTLFGLSWLSADGLASGLFACWRLLLALAVALLLAATTPPDALAAAFAWLLRPLERLGVPVAAGAEMLRMVLHFIPLLRDEALAAHAGLVAAEGGIPPRGYLARGRFVCRLVSPLLLRLVDRADGIAQRLARGETLPEWSGGTVLAPGRVMPILGFAVVTLLAAVFYGRLG